jgi:transcriptional repressor NrdR
VQLRELIIVKKGGEKKEPFDREKLTRSLKTALQKRQVEEEKIERISNSIQRKLETLGESEVPSKAIGEIVMDQLADLDQVAYVLFASVYRNFHEVKDFEAFIGTLSDETN